MAPAHLANDFDRMAPVYDETREGVDPRALEGLCRALSQDGAPSLLEVGVGTGRIALPLQSQGFSVTGLDASRSMISRARSKGVERLVRGNAYRVPFRASSFDYALFVHVLTLLGDPGAALRGAARVSRRGMLVDRPGELSGILGAHPLSAEGAWTKPMAAPLALLTGHTRLGTEGEDKEQVRAMTREVITELGFSLPPRVPGPDREKALIERWPPESRTVLAESAGDESPEERLEWIRKRADRTLLDVPPHVLERAIPLVRARLSGKSVRFRRTYSLVRWRADAFSASREPEGGSVGRR